MCAVGQQLAPTRQIWSNDLQAFASLVAKTQFCSVADAPSVRSVEALLAGAFHRQMELIGTESARALALEREALVSADWDVLLNAFENRIFVANRMYSGSGTRYRLFSERYAGTYFGFRQCAEIDGIRYAIDTAASEGEVREWCLVALCAAISRCANTTGHFAQALAPKPSNLSKLINQRARSVWDEFINALGRLSVFGTGQWRALNRVFQADALSLMRDTQTLAEIGLVYADPPYTSDQYSRYYHIYETLVLYDYPAARGRGLYRDDRAVSSFSHSTKVKGAMDRLIASVRNIGADLILSYPSNGLLPSSREQIVGMIREHYGRDPDVIPLIHNHSTMGASKGSATHQVVEVLYRARVANVAV
jgi:adenine-specific DNA-methyltransferase